MDTKAEARDAANLLTAWARNDFDGFAEALHLISSSGDDLIAYLDDQDGDARGIQSDLGAELESLAALVRGALFLARHAIDLAMDPPASRFLSRDAVIAHLLDQP